MEVDRMTEMIDLSILCEDDVDDEEDFGEMV